MLLETLFFFDIKFGEIAVVDNEGSPKEIMSTQNAKPEEKTSGSDMALVSLAVILALAGVCGFSFLSDQTLLVRLGVLIGGLVFAVVVAWFSPSGKRFIVYGRESYDVELYRYGHCVCCRRRGIFVLGRYDR